MDDVIQKLLQSTGLSCDDLLQSLQKYKSAQAKTQNTAENESSTLNNEQNVILKNQSSDLETTTCSNEEKCEVTQQIQVASPFNVPLCCDDSIQDIIKDATHIHTLNEVNNTKSEVCYTSLVESTERKLEKESCFRKLSSNDEKDIESISSKIDNVNSELEANTSEAIHDTEKTVQDNDCEILNVSSLDELSCHITEISEIKDTSVIEETEINTNQEEAYSEIVQNIGNEEVTLYEELEEIVQDNNSESCPNLAMEINVVEEKDESNNISEDTDYQEDSNSQTIPTNEKEPTCHKTKLADVMKPCISSNVSNELEEYLEHNNKQQNSEIKPIKIVEEKSRNPDISDNVNVSKIPKPPEASFPFNGNKRKVEELEEPNTSLKIPRFDDGETSTSSNISIPTEADALRNVLRMQLSCLRNMKKRNVEPLPPKPEIFFSNTKRKQKSQEIGFFSRHREAEEVMKEDSNDAILQSTDSSFVILDVTGGIDQLSNQEWKENVIDVCSSLEKDEVNSLSEGLELFQSIVRKRKRLNSYFSDDSSSGDPKLETKSADNTMKPLVSIKALLGSTFTNDPGVTVAPLTEKSPFVSNSLDNFLNENRQLKVSYPIPKLGAEDGLTEKPSTTIQKQRMGILRKQSPATNKKVDDAKPFKPKTLADKRRYLMEQMQNQRKVCKKSTGAKATKPQKEPKHERTQKRNSYVLYNKKKLWVYSTSTLRYLATVGEPPERTRPKIPFNKERTSPETPVRKPSLLSTLNEKKSVKVTYRPGPLCKKAQLQNPESCSIWESKEKNLPKVFLEVVGEHKKPVNPEIYCYLRPLQEPIISEDHAKFALTALKGNNKPFPIKFEVPYAHNQQKIIVRKRRPKTIPIEDENIEEEPSKQVSKVIEKLLNYVEIKELSDTLIQEDDSVVEEIESNEITPKTGKSPKIKRRRIELELLRLNCKVIDMGGLLGVKDEKTCTKPHCKFGCICNSLQCNSFFSNHCQLVECMFKCTCASTSKPQIHTDNHSLSEEAVNILDDKAKKNLAKEERAFTQTLIHTDNDVILVGAGGRSTSKRTSKKPKKYSDYVENTELAVEPPKLDRTECRVELTRLRFDQIVPYCLYHKVHKCDCLHSSKPFDNHRQLTVPKLKIKKLNEATCVRIRKVPDAFKYRNAEPTYTKLLRRKYKAQIRAETKIVIPTLETSEAKKASKRKQSFEVRQDYNVTQDNATKALQRRKKKEVIKAPPVPVQNTVEPLFEGEIQASMSENVNIRKMIGKKHANLKYIRIIPWSKLLEGYQKQKIFIWAKKTNAAIILTSVHASTKPSQNYIDISLMTNKTRIITSMLTGVPPDNTPLEKAHLIHIILVPKGVNYLISGYCLKNTTETITTEPTAIEPTTNLHFFNSEGPLPSLLTDVNNAIRNLLGKTVKCTHTDMNNIENTLVLSTKHFEGRQLYIKQETNVEPIIVALPKAPEKLRWRMVLLKDFRYLLFNPANYSIGYEDLNLLMSLPRKLNLTMLLRNKFLCEHYTHPAFGIIMVPNYDDRIFVGPFVPNEKDNLVIILNDERRVDVGHWLYEKVSGIPTETIIDITEDDDVEVVAETPRPVVLDNFLCAPFVTELTSEEIRTRSINRCITTNIPHFGYICAYQWPSKCDIDVYWPCYTKGYRFPNVTFAKHSLIQYLSQVLTRVPSTFKINVVIMINLDLGSNKLANPEYLVENNSYICGEFGILHTRDLPRSLLEANNISCVSDLVHKQEDDEANMARLVHLLGLYLMSNQELRKHSTADDILKWVTSEIYIQRKLHENYRAEVEDLERIVIQNREIVNRLMSTNNEPLNPIAEETIEIVDSEDDDEIAIVPITNFTKIEASGKINDGRSLLKCNVPSVRSLLKTNERRSSDTSPIKICGSNNRRVVMSHTLKKHKNSAKITMERIQTSE